MSALAITPGLITHATGLSTANGAIGASSATGGTGSYTSYAWTGTYAVSSPTSNAAKSSLLPGQYTLTVTDSAAATASYVYDVSYTSIISTAYIVKNANPSTNALLGWSCAADGQYMIVGAYWKEQGAVTKAGAAYIFRRSNTYSTGTYSLEKSLASSVVGASFNFGYSVAISGDTVVVGEPNGGAAGSFTGSAYMWYRSSGTTWDAQGPTPLLGSDTGYGDQLGYSVAIDGQYMVVGAPNWNRKTPTAVSDCGAAYVFLRTGSTWAQQQQLQQPSNDATASDFFGKFVAMNGSTVVVGAPAWDRKTPTAISDCGAAYVFVRSGTTWSQQQRLEAADPSQSDGLANSVTVSGDLIVLGATAWSQKTPSAISSCGAAYVYTRTGSTWTQQSRLTAGDLTANAAYGCSVSSNSSSLVVGSNGRASGYGSAYVYRRSGSALSLAKVFIATDIPGAMGTSVGVTDRYVVAGAYSWYATASNQGAVYTATLPGVSASLSVSPGLVTHATGFATANGAIAVTTVSGGVGTVSYAWTDLSGASATSTPTTLAAKSALLPGRYILTATDAEGSTGVYNFDVAYVNPLSSTYIVTAGADAATNDSLGYSCAVDGLYMVAGAPIKTVNGFTTAGVAYIFKRSDATDTGTYSLEFKLTPDTAGTGYQFGFASAISGDTVVVGERGGGTGGQAHVWFRTGGTTWVRQTPNPLVPSDPTSGDQFGHSVAIDGEYIAVGAPSWDTKSPSVLSCGAAYVFVRSGTTWSQQGATPLTPSDSRTASDSFGCSIAISGATVIVGAKLWAQKFPTLNACGCAYSFVRSGTSWTQQQQLLAGDASAGDQFGNSVSISGDDAVVGANQWALKTPSVLTCGCAYVFTRMGTTWTATTQLVAGDPVSGDTLGTCVSIYGTTVVAGAPSRTSSSRGAAYVYIKTGGGYWSPARVVTASDAADSDTLGFWVDASDKYIAVAAPGWEGALTNQGAVYTTVPVPTIVIAVSGGGITPSNFGASTGVIAAITASGGSGTFVSYVWSSSAGATTGLAADAATHSGLSPGTYTLVVTDSIGGTGRFDYIVTEYAAVTVSGGTISNVAVNGGSTGAIGIMSASGGTGTFVSYTWASSAGATQSLAAGTQAHTALKAGIYTVTVTDNKGGVGTRAFTVTENAVISVSGGAITDVAIYGQSTGAIAAITASGGTGAYTSYTWVTTNGGTTGLAANNSAHSELKAGTYTLTVTDSAGATLVQPFVVNQNPVISYTGGSVTDVLVYGQATGSISALTVSGGSGAGYTYLWTGSGVSGSTSNTAKTGLTAGSYSVTIGDSVGASLTVPFTITQNPVLSYTGGAITNVAIYGQSTGAIASLVVSGGTGSGYTFSWSSAVPSPGSNTAKTGLTAGSYSVTIGDSAGASLTVPFVITQNPVLSYTGGVVTSVAVNGAATGQIAALVITGGSGSGYTFNWSGSYAVPNPTVNEAKTGLRAGSYSCSISDSVGAVRLASFTVTQNPVLSYTGGAITNVAVNGQATGAIASITVTGGSSSYVGYAWTSSSGATTGLASDAAAHTGLKSGAYTLVVTDNVGGIGTFDFIVTEPPVLAVTGGAVTNVAIYGQSTGAIAAVTATGGSGSFASYAWSSSLGATTGLAANASPHTDLHAGTYTLVVTDSGGGTVTRQFIVLQNPILSYTGGVVTHAAVAGEASGSISAVTAAGGSGAGFTYSWTGSGIASTTDGTAKMGLAAGVYTCAVGDDAGSVLSLSFEVGEPLSVTVASAVNQSRTVDGSVSLSVTGGVGSKSYAWTRDGETFAGSGPSLTGLTNGFYTCAATSGPFSVTASALVITTYLTTTTGPRALRLEWPPVPGALAYGVEYRVSGDGVYKSLALRTFVPFAVVSGLEPLTAYELRVSATTGRAASSRVYYTDTASTTAEQTEEFSPLALQVSVQTVMGATAQDGSFALRKVAVLYLPRDVVAAVPRDVNLTLLDGSSVSVSYDAIDESVSFGGIRYGAGDTIDFGGQQVLVRVKS